MSNSGWLECTGYSPISSSNSGLEFLQIPGRTPASGSPLEGTPVPRIPARRNPGSPLRTFPGPVPGSPPSYRKWKTSDKENLPYFRMWKSLAYSNRLRPTRTRVLTQNCCSFRAARMGSTLRDLEIRARRLELGFLLITVVVPAL
ncbi:hypothetical protein DY000_02014370 [Brassica cretica]|nr:hypothetical protein DY000_02014370 [Brassica cretica]